MANPYTLRERDRQKGKFLHFLLVYTAKMTGDQTGKREIWAAPLDSHNTMVTLPP